MAVGGLTGFEVGCAAPVARRKNHSKILNNSFGGPIPCSCSEAFDFSSPGNRLVHREVEEPSMESVSCDPVSPLTFQIRN